MTVMIGIDPHKGSHTAVAVTAAEEPLGKVRIRACPAQAGQLVAWAAAWPERTWANRGGHALYRTCAGRSSLFRATPWQGPTGAGASI